MRRSIVLQAPAGGPCSRPRDRVGSRLRSRRYARRHATCGSPPLVIRPVPPVGFRFPDCALDGLVVVGERLPGL